MTDVDCLLGGITGIPIVGVVGVPIVGGVGVPMVGVVGVPIVGNVGVPMVGVVGVPIVGKVGVPIVGVVGVPMVGRVVPTVGIVETPVPNVGDRVFKPGVTAVGIGDDMAALTPVDADIGAPKFVRLDGSNNTDCAWTVQGHAASPTGTSQLMILFIPPPCVVPARFPFVYLNRPGGVRAVPLDI
jgi:hypothetical protein